jgi:carbohydrate-selective porin OprB
MVFAGACYKGPFAARPNDSAGLAVSLVDVNPRVTERVNSLLSLLFGLPTLPE